MMDGLNGFALNVHLNGLKAENFTKNEGFSLDLDSPAWIEKDIYIPG